MNHHKNQVLRKVLFYRDYRGFTGGHLKVWDYFSHVRSSPYHTPQIFFSRHTIWDESNPWNGSEQYSVHTWCPEKADILFLGGLDWLNLDVNERKYYRKPIVNIIQNVRHGNPKDERYSFLTCRAIRICIDHEVIEAIRYISGLNGPVFQVNIGMEWNDLPELMGDSERTINLLVAGVKRPEIARILEEKLSLPGKAITVLTRLIPRHDFLKLMNRARITVFLPNDMEGCYLPALEGMALGTIVICPDVQGSHSCIGGFNCLKPDYTVDAIIEAIHNAITSPPDELQKMRVSALETARSHSFQRERESFLEILNNVDDIW